MKQKRICPKCNKELVRRENENGTTWKRRVYCSHSCSRLGKKLSVVTIEKIIKNRKGKGLGNTNGLGKNLNNQNARGKVSGSDNGNWKGGVSLLQYKESIAGRKKPRRCEVCYEECSPDFDHCHKKGNFRGWICRRCNLVLGMVKDNQILLRNLALYLDIDNKATRPKRIKHGLLQHDNSNKKDIQPKEKN